MESNDLKDRIWNEGPVERSFEEDTQEEQSWESFWEEEEKREQFRKEYFKVWGYYPRPRG